MTSPAGISRLIVSVADLDRALAFYRDAVGVPVAVAQPGFAVLRTGDGVQIMLHERVTVPSPAGVSIGFLVDDVDAAVERATAAGGDVIDPPAQQPWGERMAVLTDPFGHPVTLSQPTG